MKPYRPLFGPALLLVCTAFCVISAPAQAANAAYPDKPVTLVVPFPPGGPTDMTARLFAEAMSRELGQPIVIRNEPGAGGVVGSTSVARKPADGYTLLWGGTSSMVVAPAINKNIQFDPLNDFEAIGTAVRGPMLLVGKKGKDSPADLQALISETKGHQLTIGSAGNGSIGHLTSAMFKSEYSLDLLHVPYKGGAPALTDLLSGQIDLLFDTVPLLAQYIKADKVIAYGIASEARHPDLPEVPTFKEVTGNPLVAYSWFGLVAPKGTPPDIVNKLSGALAKASNTASVQKQISTLGLTTVGDTPADFKNTLKHDLDMWTRVAKEAGVSLQEK